MNYYLISADVGLTLKILRQGADYETSDVMNYQYFFLVPEIFAAKLAENSEQLMYQIYDEHYENFKLKEPNDPNYIAVVDVAAKILASSDYASLPWLNVEIPVWETSNCIMIQNGGYQKIEPKNFGGILGIWKRHFTNTTVI